MLDQIKNLIGLSDDKRDKVLEDIIKTMSSRLLGKLDGNKDEVPKDLEYIVVEISVMRYNRLGDEGLKSYGQTGHSMTYSDDYFSEFEDDIESWNKKNGESKRGKVVYG